MPEQRKQVCSVEHANLLDHRLRRWFQNPDKLLAPYVRAGLLVAVRGRTGGYRAGEGLLESPLSTVLAPFGAPSRRARAAAGKGLSRLVEAVESEAAAARLAVYARWTVGDLVARHRADRHVIDWEI